VSNNFLTPAEIAEVAAKTGQDKSKYSVVKLLILGFLAGAFIALGALFDIRVTASIPAQWVSIKNLVGGAVFPIGLMFVVVAGGELLTGNMMTLPMALHDKRIRITGLIYNWFWVLIGNLIGSLFVAYFFGVVAKMLTVAPYDKATMAIAVSKASLGFGPTIFSAIGCNCLVCLGIWMAYGSKDIIGKLFAIWFSVMGFVAIGFQHVVANMFFLPAGIFVGAHVSWGKAIVELIAAFIGNAIGGWLFVATVYWVTYLRGNKSSDGDRVKGEVRGEART
jgi:formate transporter